MARKKQADVAKAKAAKQKKIAIAGGVLLVAVLAIQGPKTMRMLNAKPAQPVTAPAPTTPGTADTGAPATPSLAAPTLSAAPTSASAAAPSTQLIAAVTAPPDPGQLESFERFATKDPFLEQVSSSGVAPAAGGGSAGSAGSGSVGKSGSDGAGSSSHAGGSTPKAPPAPPAPPPVSAVISLNQELMSVSTGTDFPSEGTIFDQVGTVFHLLSLTAKTAKIAIAGGSYANGSAAITLHVGKPVTLQNTADGTRYTLILEPQGTVVPAPAGPSSSGTSTTPAPTTPAPTPVVPSSGGG